MLAASGSQAPVLTSVTTAYLPRNLRPEIASITVHPAGTVFQRPFSTGEMEIAGFEDSTSDGRAQPQSASTPGGQSGSAPALGRLRGGQHRQASRVEGLSDFRDDDRRRHEQDFVSGARREI